MLQNILEHLSFMGLALEPGKYFIHFLKSGIPELSIV